MKNLIPSFLLMWSFLSIYAQDFSPSSIETEANPGEIFIFIADASVQEYDLRNKSPRSNFKIAQRGNKCRIIGYQNKQYILRFGSFPYNDGTRDIEKKDDDYLCNQDNNNYFTLDALDFHKVAIVYPKVRSFIFGALLVPIKLRPGKKDERFFDFSKDVSIGTSFGYRWGISKFRPHYTDLLFGVGISSITADETTTLGFISKSTNLAAFSLSLGGLLEFSDIQIGLFTGLDWLARDAGESWIYQGKLWFSIGIGYQIFAKNITMGKGSIANK